MEKEKLAYKIGNFAKLADLSYRFVQSEIYAGNLRAVKCGNRWRIPIDEAHRYLGIKEKAQNQVEVSQATA